MPRLSIVIPCLGAPEQFENTLASVLQHRPKQCEIVVAHAEAYRDPYRIGGEACLMHVPEARSLADLLNSGFEASCSPVVHVLAPGVYATADWVEPALAMFDNEQVGAVLPLLVDISQPDRVLAAGWQMNSWGRCHLLHAGEKRSRPIAVNQWTGPTQAGGFYRRAAWRHIRWETKSDELFMPLRFALLAQAVGWESRFAAECVLKAGGDFLPSITEPFTYEQARSVEQLYWLHHRATSKISGLSHALYLLVETLLALPSPRAISGLWGRLRGWYSRPQPEELERLVAEIKLKREQESLPTEDDNILRFPTRGVPKQPASSSRRAA